MGILKTTFDSIPCSRPWVKNNQVDERIQICGINVRISTGLNRDIQNVLVSAGYLEYSPCLRGDTTLIHMVKK